ncbi:MAG: DNA-binding protein [Verrucomicrobia bacterium]|nr:DNA-binding protein [Verrucomicrobiota bacterium]
MSVKENRIIAERLREAASLLEQQGANRFRVAAYRRAAETVESLPQDVGLLLRTEGFQGLTALPGIGSQIGGAIAEMVRTGQWTQLDRLRGHLDPESLFARIPGIGPKLARRVLDDLHIDTLEELEMAVYSGRLGNVPGFGNRRLAMVRATLAEMLGRGRRRGRAAPHEPPVDILLDVDREYRDKAAANTLRRIAPKRFNPTNEAWLPVLHTERGVWQFTALYSNTALAHSLGRTQDWVVMYFQSDSYTEGQRTVVTETQGSLKGKRVVRGRENECAEHYRSLWPRPSNVA